MPNDLNVRVALLEERIEWMRENLQLQASEYARRLGDLNHAHAEAKQTLETYLPRESWEQWVNEYEGRRDRVDQRLAELAKDAATSRAAASAAAAANARNIALATLVLAVVVLFTNHAF